MSQVEGGRSGGGGSLTVLDDLVEFCGDLGHGWQYNVESRVIREGRSEAGQGEREREGKEERRGNPMISWRFERLGREIDACLSLDLCLDVRRNGDATARARI